MRRCMPGEIIICYQPTTEIELQYPFKKFQKEKKNILHFPNMLQHFYVIFSWKCSMILCCYLLGDWGRPRGHHDLVYPAWRNRQVIICRILYSICSVSGYNWKPPLYTSFWRPFPFSRANFTANWSCNNSIQLFKDFEGGFVYSWLIAIDH